MASALRIGVPTGSVAWSDGSAFNGYALVGLKTLTDGTNAWPSISMGHRYISRSLPTWAMMPITDGQYDQICGVYYNADLTPPNDQYVALFFDTNNKQIGTYTSAFNVSTSSFTIPSITLTLPTVGANPSVDT